MSEEPRSEYILTQIITALEQISVANGYSFSPREVFRWDSDTRDTMPPVIEVQHAGEYKRAQGSLIVSSYETLFDAFLLCNIVKDEGSTVAMDRIVNLAIADVEQALTSLVPWSDIEARIEEMESRPYPALSERELFDGFQVRLQISFSLDPAQLWKHLPQNRK